MTSSLSCLSGDEAEYLIGQTITKVEHLNSVLKLTFASGDVLDVETAEKKPLSEDAQPCAVQAQSRLMIDAEPLIPFLDLSNQLLCAMTNLSSAMGEIPTYPFGISQEERDRLSENHFDLEKKYRLEEHYRTMTVLDLAAALENLVEATRSGLDAPKISGPGMIISLRALRRSQGQL